MGTINLLAICTSPRQKRYTAQLLDKAVAGAESCDGQNDITVKTTLFSVAGKNLQPCVGCRACQKGHEGCVLKDDMGELHKLMQAADGILIASPVYFYDINAQCKIIIDRSYAISPLNGAKAGGILITAGSIGTSGAIKTLQMFYNVQGITPTGWVSAYANVGEYEKAYQSAHALGQKTVQVAKALKQVAGDSLNRLNHFAYGTHTF